LAFFAVLVSVSDGGPPATMVCLWQPASAAAAASASRSGVRVIFCPFAARALTVKGNFLHIVELGHSFADIDG
jgi:hypothetical protein